MRLPLKTPKTKEEKVAETKGTQKTNLTNQDLENLMRNEKTKTRARAFNQIHERGDMTDDKLVKELETLKEELEGM